MEMKRNLSILCWSLFGLIAVPALGNEVSSIKDDLGQSLTKDNDLLIAPVVQYAQEGQEISAQLGTPDGEEVLYSVEGLPPGLSMDSQTGLVSGMLGQESSGRYLTRIVAESGRMREIMSFPWYVLEDEVPQIQSPGLVTSTAGELIEMPVAVTFEDVGAADLNLTAINLPPGLELGGDGMIRGTLEASDRLVSYQVTIHAAHFAQNEESRLPAWGGTVFTWVVFPTTE